MGTCENLSESEKQIIHYIVSGDQVNINTGNGMINTVQNNDGKVCQKQILILNNNDQQKYCNTKASDISNNGDILLAVVALVYVVTIYVRYRWQIWIGIIMLSFIIEFMTCMLYYKGKKRGILYDINVKEIAIFNIVSVLLVPIMIGFISSPLYNRETNFEFFKQQMISKGVIQTYFAVPEGRNVIFQVAGIILIVLFLIYIIISDLYIIALLNVIMEKKGQWFWKWLLRRTCGKSKDGIKHIQKGAVLVTMSVIMVIGILPYVLNCYSKVNW